MSQCSSSPTAISMTQSLDCETATIYRDGNMPSAHQRGGNATDSFPAGTADGLCLWEKGCPRPGPLAPPPSAGTLRGHLCKVLNDS